MAMSSSSRINGGSEEEARQLAAELSKTLKEGERILAPTRRPDGTLRKPIRIRAGYVPQEEVAKYQSKGALWKKEMESLQEVPPGYNPMTVVDAKPKTKSAKRNERKKEKRQQASLDKDNNEDGNKDSESVASLVSEMDNLAISANVTEVAPTSNLNSVGSSAPLELAQDFDKRIRALKKKIRLTESQLEKTALKDMKPEQSEKITKLEAWAEELNQLEHRKAELS